MLIRCYASPEKISPVLPWPKKSHPPKVSHPNLLPWNAHHPPELPTHHVDSSGTFGSSSHPRVFHLSSHCLSLWQLRPFGRSGQETRNHPCLTSYSHTSHLAGQEILLSVQGMPRTQGWLSPLQLPPPRETRWGSPLRHCRKRLTQCSVSILILFVLGCLQCSHLRVPVFLCHQSLPVAHGLDLVTCSQGTESGRVMVSVCLSVLQITGSRRKPTAKSEAVHWSGPHGEQLKPSANSYTNELGNSPAGPIPLLAVCRLRIRFLCSYPSSDLPFPAA